MKGHRPSPKLNNKNRWLVIVFIDIVLASVTIAISFYYTGIMKPTASTTTPPKFKIEKSIPQNLVEESGLSTLMIQQVMGYSILVLKLVSRPMAHGK